MKIRNLLRPALVLSGALIVGIPAATPAQAGLFDFIFGGGGGFERPQPRYYSPQSGYGEPLGVRVNPRRKRREVARPRKERAPKAIAQVPKVDPSKTPNWYLSDSTLRRGDIVVLKGRVVVFEGGHAPFAQEDFTALEKSRLVSKKERGAILKMAGPSSGTDAVVEPAPVKSTSTDPASREASLR